jgi:hypothetical protein
MEDRRIILIVTAVLFGSLIKFFNYKPGSMLQAFNARRKDFAVLPVNRSIFETIMMVFFILKRPFQVSKTIFF